MDDKHQVQRNIRLCALVCIGNENKGERRMIRFGVGMLVGIIFFIALVYVIGKLLYWLIGYFDDKSR